MQGITGEQTINSQPSGRPGRSRRRWLIVLAALIVILICLVPAVVLHHGPSIDEQLAAIEAARAIPDGENAAILYNQLMRHCPVIADVSEAVDKITRYEPWRKAAYPEDRGDSRQRRSVHRRRCRRSFVRRRSRAPQ